MVSVRGHMPQTGAVDELFDEFEEDTPEDVIALADGESGGAGSDEGVFEGGLTVPERTTSVSEDGDESVPDVDVEALFGQ